MDFELRKGLSGEVEEIVTADNTARKFGSGGIDVFATPAMIALMEKAALNTAAPYLPEGFSTVGTEIRVSHVAATPLGLLVKAKAELIEIDGRRLVFHVEAFDDVEKIGEGEHQRFIIQVAKFMEKVGQKA